MAKPATPIWLRDYFRLIAKRLNITPEWSLKCEVAHVIGGDVYCEGLCLTYPKVNQAIITVRSDLAERPTPGGKMVVIHELLHVKTARVNTFLEGVVFPETGTYNSGPLSKTHTQLNESFIESMAVALYNSWEGK